MAPILRVAYLAHEWGVLSFPVTVNQNGDVHELVEAHAT